MSKLLITFSTEAFEDYKECQIQDKKSLKKINQLIKSIERERVHRGIGKPEKLKGTLCGWYSRRITEEHKQDKKNIKKINQLIKSIEREGELSGIGKPEKLKGNLSGWYSRRITQEHRLVYKIDKRSIMIASCKYHYK